MAELVAWVAVVTGILRAWPQLRLIVVKRHTEGVSVDSWLLATAGSLSWLLIGVESGMASLIALNVFGTLGGTAVLAGLVVHGQARTRSVVVALGGVLALDALLFAAVGGVGLEVVGTALAVVAFLPQLVLVLRAPPDGVSLGTWVLSFVSQGCWMITGFMLGQMVLVWCNLVMVPAALVITLKVVAHRRTVAAKSYASL